MVVDRAVPERLAHEWPLLPDIGMIEAGAAEHHDVLRGDLLVVATSRQQGPQRLERLGRRGDLDHLRRSTTGGERASARLLLVVTSEGGPRPRIISAWRATKRERREYEGR